MGCRICICILFLCIGAITAISFSDQHLIERCEELERKVTELQDLINDLREDEDNEEGKTINEYSFRFMSVLLLNFTLAFHILFFNSCFYFVLWEKNYHFFVFLYL